MDTKYLFSSSILSMSTILSYIYGSPPDIIKNGILCAITLILIDTISGIILAYLLGKIKSKTLRTGILIKMWQYFSMGVIAKVLDTQLGSWTITIGILALIGNIEIQSIIENFAKMRKFGGIDMGPVNKFLDKVAPKLDLKE